MKPLILINFKTYKAGTGKAGWELAKVIAGIRSKYQLVIAPQLVDLKEICGKVKIPVFAQHIDGIGFGAYTGSVLPEAVKEAGAKGTLMNHSEQRISLKEIRNLVKICRRLKLVTVVCAGSLSMLKRIARFSPDYIAYEPKKLIGGDVSVTEVNPKVISKAVKLVKKNNPKVKVLCGAGIHSRKDVLKALELGMEGVLISHKIVKAKEPGKVLKSMFS